MAITKEDLQDFTQFADGKLVGGSAESLQELVLQWEAARQREEVNVAIQQGLAEADAGLGLPLDEFMDEFRKKNNLAADE